MLKRNSLYKRVLSKTIFSADILHLFFTLSSSSGKSPQLCLIIKSGTNILFIGIEILFSIIVSIISNALLAISSIGMRREVTVGVVYSKASSSLRRQLEGSGLLLENMIGFASWFADDPSKRKEGLNQMRHDMEMVAGLGGKFIAAPAQGVTQLDRTRLPEYSERYRAILDLG